MQGNSGERRTGPTIRRLRRPGRGRWLAKLQRYENPVVFRSGPKFRKDTSSRNTFGLLAGMGPGDEFSCLGEILFAQQGTQFTQIEFFDLKQGHIEKRLTK